MPRVAKTAFVNFASTGCEKQLRIGLHPNTNQFRHERTALRLPDPQIRPALQDMTAAGNEWGEAKVKELQDGFGAGSLLGGPRRLKGQTRLHFDKSLLRDHLRAGVAVGQFLIETTYKVGTPTFLRVHDLEHVLMDGAEVPLAFRQARPDIIEVLAPQDGAEIVTPDGTVSPSPPGDTRLRLRVIDVKLTSEPGPRYFSELAFYSLSLAAWLEDRGFGRRFSVSADAAVWPGSEQSTRFADLIGSGTTTERREAFHEVLELAPLRIFLGEVLRVLRRVIPRLLNTPFEEIPWAVTPACQGCENLGQHFRDEPGDAASDWRPEHCLPLARTQQHLSRLPYLSRGSLSVLRDRGHDDVNAIALLSSDDSTFDAHHRLRGQRAILGSRARALAGRTEDPLDIATATTAAIPNFAKLRIFLTADFDPSSAITLAFGMTWGWVATGPQPTFPKRRTHYTTARSAAAEWASFSALLGEIDAVIREARALDPTATFQVYVWDQLTLTHLKRVVSRHLARIIGIGVTHLAWLFPPSELVGNARITSTPAVSVVKDAVRSLVTLRLAHNYNLLDTARNFHQPATPNARFSVPPFWEDPFSDQIPPERAHQMWQNRHVPGRPTQTQLLSMLSSTVVSKLMALQNVTDHLTELLRGRLPRRAPQLSQLRGPEDLASSSHLGALVYAHTRLDIALQQIDTSVTRSLPLLEREARGATAVLTRRLTKAQSATWRAANNIGADALIYELSASSTEFKGKEDQMGWTALPAELTHFADASVASFLRATQRAPLARTLGTDAERAKLGAVFEVNFRLIDRDMNRVALSFKTFHQNLRNRLIDAGAVDVSGEIVVDAITGDFLSKPLSEAIKAIKSPPSAGVDPRIQQAIGTTRTPRTGPPHPSEHFLWTAGATAATAVRRDLAALRASLGERHMLDASQREAWTAALSSRLTLIWGPPGTGKTQTVRAILAALAAESRTRPLRIAVTANIYSAMDNIIEPMHDELPNLYRLHSGERGVAWLDGQHSLDARQTTALVQRLRRPQSTIVAATPQQLTKLVAKFRGLGNPGVFDAVIIDEAGAMDVAHGILALEGVTDDATVIVAGDPLQLPPIHQGEPPLGLQEYVGSIYNFFRDGHHVPASELLNNYRSNSGIVDLARRAGYPVGLNAVHPDRRLIFDSARLASSRDRWPSNVPINDDLIDIASPTKPIVCVTYPEGVSGQWNAFEVDQVVALITWYERTLLRGVDGNGAPMTVEYFWTRGVGVVTPHRAQRARIVARLTELFADSHPHAARWIADAVDTVERFQGQERDVVVASYAVGDPDTVAEEAEFLLNLNRFNVLATRAKAKLVVFVTEEVVGHLGNDLEILRSSGLLKDFVNVYCDTYRSGELEAVTDGVHSARSVEIRWPRP